jgi:hypothetical protein
MENEINQEQTEDAAVTLSAEQAVANLKNDVKAYTKSLEMAEADLANYIEQLDVDKQMWDILEKEGSVRRLNPMFEYENDPNWDKLQHKKQLFKLKQDRAMAEGTVKQFEDQIKNTQRAIEEAKEKLDRFNGDSE